MEKDGLVVGLRGLFVCTRVGLKDVIVGSTVLTSGVGALNVLSIEVVVFLRVSRVGGDEKSVVVARKSG